MSESVSKSGTSSETDQGRGETRPHQSAASTPVGRDAFHRVPNLLPGALPPAPPAPHSPPVSASPHSGTRDSDFLRPSALGLQPSPPQGAGSPREQVAARLGLRAFLVPCEYGTKRPLLTYVERTWAQTQSAAYRAVFELEPVNIAVYLGKASDGLCAIDFDADDDLESFLALNPKLTGTLRSRGSRGGMVWVRIEGEYPESCNPAHKHFERQADCRLSTLYGRHPKGMDYTLVVDTQPVTLRFEEIVWPESWELPWKSGGDGNLKELYGEPFYTTDKGLLTGMIDEGTSTYKEFGSPVRSVREKEGALGTPKNAASQGEKLPYLMADGTLVIPLDSPERYHWWRKGGQSVEQTLAEIRRPKTQDQIEQDQQEIFYGDDV